MSSRVTSVCFDSQSRLAFLHCVYIRDVRSPIEYGSFAPRLNQLSIRFGCSFLRYLIAIPERGHVLIKRTISKVCSAFNYSLWAIKDIRIRKRDYRARGQYFCFANTIDTKRRRHRWFYLRLVSSIQCHVNFEIV